jgi:hypothetical protein
LLLLLLRGTESLELLLLLFVLGVGGNKEEKCILDIFLFPVELKRIRFCIFGCNDQFGDHLRDD